MNPNDTKPTVPQPGPQEQPIQPATSEPLAPQAPVLPSSSAPMGSPPQISSPTYESVQNPVTIPSSQPLSPGLSQLKSLFLKILVGCLIASATVAVTAILAGGLGDIGSKALGTIIVVGLHALLALGFIGMDGTHNDEGGLKVFANVVFGLLVASFITATLGIWGILPGEWAWKLYASYGVLAVAILHGELLARVLNHQKNTDHIVYANFIVMSLVVLLLFALIFIPDIDALMGAAFFRPLAALAVIDGTLTLTAIILDRLYLSKHPDLITTDTIVAKSKGSGPRVLVIVVMILLGLQMVPALLFALLGGGL